MVLISSKKYACETCIKGHRSSACKHTDRPLFEIKKKGRPVTQCEHCRELRKTKQVHVKCICEAKEPTSPTAAPKKKGTPTLPAHAAFPNGVPDAGSATTSDSDHGGSTQSASASAPGCSCLVTGAACHCCTPRTRPARRRSEPPPPASTLTKNSNSNSPSPTLSGNTNNTSPVLPATPHPTPLPSPNPTHPNSTASARPPSHHILARIAELRPVLPRLSPRDAALMQAGQHDLFHHSHSHHASCHGEHFSPYSRAYEHALMHPPDYSSDASTSSAGFYQQDARSAESLLSVASVASHRSVASQPPAVGHRNQRQKSHSQKSPSYDGGSGHPASSGIFGATSNPDWRLPPSLSRSTASAEEVPSYSNASNANAAFAPRPRSEGGEVYSLGNAAAADATAPFVSRPRSEAAHPRVGSDPSPQSGTRSEDGVFGSRTDVRTCGCGAGCACPGCTLHGVSPRVSVSSSNGTSNGSGSGGATTSGRHCADPAQCGGACLDCTILGLSDFGAVVGFGEGAVFTKEGFRKEEYLFEGGDVIGELDVYDLAQDGYDLDLDLGGDADALEQQRQSAAIDEWIREVGTISMPPPSQPPPASALGVPPFEFDGAMVNAKVEFDAMEFDLGQAWMFDVDPTRDGDGPVPVPMQGLTGADVVSPAPSSAFLTVPGPVAGAHGRSRSSSSASSEVSIPSAGVGIGVGASANGLGASGAGGAGLGLGLTVPALDPHPLQAPAGAGMKMEMEMEMEMAALDRDHASPASASVPALLFPPAPAAYTDEQMLFF